MKTFTTVSFIVVSVAIICFVLFQYTEETPILTLDDVLNCDGWKEKGYCTNQNSQKISVREGDDGNPIVQYTIIFNPPKEVK